MLILTQTIKDNLIGKTIKNVEANNDDNDDEVKFTFTDETTLTVTGGASCGTGILELK